MQFHRPATALAAPPGQWGRVSPVVLIRSTLQFLDEHASRGDATAVTDLSPVTWLTTLKRLDLDGIPATDFSLIAVCPPSKSWA